MGRLEDALELVVANSVVSKVRLDPGIHRLFALLKRKRCLVAQHFSELFPELLPIFGDERANLLEIF